MSSRREVSIRIELLQRKKLIETKKSQIKMLKMALLDCAITEDGAFDSSRVPTAGKKNGNVRRGGGGDDWAQLELTDA